MSAERPAFTIRPVCAEDVPALNEIRRQPGVLDFILSIPSERLASSERWFESLGPDAHTFVAEVEGRVVGTAGLHVRTGRQRHAAALGIMVHKDLHGRGIGRALMHAILDVADNWLLLVRVELEVFADNAPAIALYESLGFETEGRKRKDTIRHGTYEDILMMGRIRE